MGRTEAQIPRSSFMGDADLKLLAPRIEVGTREFRKEQFLLSELGVKVHPEDSFAFQIVPQAPVMIPAYSDFVSAYENTRDMTDAEIQAKFHDHQYFFTQTQILNILYGMLSKQSDGRKGDLHVEGEYNVFYVLENVGTMAFVMARWYKKRGIWILRAECNRPPARHRGGRIFMRC